MKNRILTMLIVALLCMGLVLALGSCDNASEPSDSGNANGPNGSNDDSNDSNGSDSSDDSDKPNGSDDSNESDDPNNSDDSDSKKDETTSDEDDAFIVSFDSNGGSPVAELTVEKGAKVVRPADPTRDCYYFRGWYYGNDSEEPWIFADLTVTSNITLTAKWTPVTYNINYVLNGGTNAESNPASYTVETDSITIAAPTREHYVFEGWYASADLDGEAVTQIACGSFGNIELYAKWSPKVYEINYVLCGGTNAESNPASYTLETNTITLADPTRAGYVFFGWFIDEQFTESITEIPHGSHENITIYAKWEAIFKVSGNSITGVTEYAKNQLTELSIPSEIDGVRISRIDSGAFHDYINLTNISIPDSITEIGAYAFFSCKKLQYNNYGNAKYLGNSENKYLALISVENASITSCEINENAAVISSGAFIDCTRLTSLTVSDSSTSFASIDGNLYSKDGKTIVLYAPGKNDSSFAIPDGVTHIGTYAFFRCKMLTEITIPNSVTSIGDSAFRSCSGMTSLTLPNSLTGIGESAFYDCSGLISLIIPNNLTKISESAFKDCNNLTSVTIPSSVTSIGEDAFRYCNSLVLVYNDSDLKLECGGENNGHVAYAAKMIIDHGNTIKINDGTDYILTSDNFMFKCIGSKYMLIAYCGTERSITLPKYINGRTYSLFYMRGAVDVTVPSTITTINSYAFNLSIRSITLPSNLKEIGDHAFFGCSALTEISIPDSVAFIGVSAFEGCKNLTEINIPSKVTIISTGTFSECINLKSISIPSGVTSIGDEAFRSCRSLTSITIPQSVTYIGAKAFLDCQSLTEAVFENTSNWNVGDIFKLVPKYLAETDTAAIYLTKEYYEYPWEREE